MIKITQPKSYKVINYVLRNRQFTQLEIAKKTRVSKGMVSYVVKWLIEKEYVEKKDKKYNLVLAAALIALFPLYRNMEKNLLGSFSVSAEPKKVMKELKKRKVVFCTTTALQQYSSYFQDISINFYSGDKRLLQDLKAEPKGLTKVNVYKPDLALKADTVKKGKMLLTNKVRTVIDLFCNKQAYTAKDLIQNEFGEKIG